MCLLLPDPQCAAEHPGALPTHRSQIPQSIGVAELELSCFSLTVELGSQGRCAVQQKGTRLSSLLPSVSFKKNAFLCDFVTP